MSSTPKKTQKVNNNDNINKKFDFNDIRIYGTTYIVKMIILLAISTLIFIFSRDLFSLSINATSFITMLAIDMCLLKDKTNILKYKIARIQYVFYIIIIIAFMASLIATLYFALHNSEYKKNELMPLCYLIFLLILGFFSSLFELIFNIHED